MIHPHTELRKVNNTIGYGVFATKLIHKGTIVYVKDPLEIEITPERFLAMEPQFQSVVNWFSYIDERGCRIVSWDIAKYVNHHCDSNSICTGYGFEIATRDIAANEEITDEYGIFNSSETLSCICGSINCRKKISSNDWNTYGRVWDQRAKDALKCFTLVQQPLLKYMDMEEYLDLMQYIDNQQNYRSIFRLRFADKKSKTKIV